MIISDQDRLKYVYTEMKKHCNNAMYFEEWLIAIDIAIKDKEF